MKCLTRIDTLALGIDFSALDQVLKSLNSEMPLNQGSTDYFPDFLTARLNSFTNRYQRDFQSVVDGACQYDAAGSQHPVLDNIKTLSAAIITAVNKYYQGNVFGATQIFNDALDNMQFMSMANLSDIVAGYNFYRARQSDVRRLTKKQLFHVPFESRHLVNTGRYSIPGFPALYFGSSVYVCWEELSNVRFDSLYYSRFSNSRQIKVIEVLPPLNFLQLNYFFTPGRGGYISPTHEATRSIRILKYISTIPLVMACSIRTAQNGPFKPEYIIPQLLLQYIVNNTDVDGIMFPSTKVDFHVPLHRLTFNYVFPVKEIAPIGYCASLQDTFEMTEPTSLELEQLKNHSAMLKIDESDSSFRAISLNNNEFANYKDTKFGYFEKVLVERNLGKLS